MICSLTSLTGSIIHSLILTLKLNLNRTMSICKSKTLVHQKSAKIHSKKPQPSESLLEAKKPMFPKAKSSHPEVAPEQAVTQPSRTARDAIWWSKTRLKAFKKSSNHLNKSKKSFNVSNPLTPVNKSLPTRNSPCVNYESNHNQKLKKIRLPCLVSRLRNLFHRTQLSRQQLTIKSKRNLWRFWETRAPVLIINLLVEIGTSKNNLLKVIRLKVRFVWMLTPIKTDFKSLS